jgi:magnesium-transporting ATPase (P-type)
MNITVNETLYDKSSGDVAKEISEGGDIKDRKNKLIGTQTDNHLQNPDPFLLSGSLVLTGQGKALVCSVGDNTLLARSRS